MKKLIAAAVLGFGLLSGACSHMSQQDQSWENYIMKPGAHAEKSTDLK